MSQKVAILGFGVEGKSALAHWQRLGAEVTICDANADLELPAGVTGSLGEDYLKGLGEYDVIVRGPAIRPDLIVAENPETPGILDKVTSVVREFIDKCPAMIIGVTGTKGKGTTSTLTMKMLETTGRRVWLGGNIGVAPLDFLEQVGPEDYVVLELSSFQLFDITKAPHISVCLMLAPEHQDWHLSVEEYYQAKANIFSKQTGGDVAIYFADNADSKRLAEQSPGTKVPYFAAPGARVDGDMIKVGETAICRTADVGLIGRHNLQNVCAALTAAWQITQDADRLAGVIKQFTGLEHRLELAGEHNGVRYYDDSFSTTPETAIAATEAFAEPKVLILGGSDKGSDYTELAAKVAGSNVRAVVLIGDMADQIKQPLQRAGYAGEMLAASSMKEIIKQAGECAKPGDVVLLSPACASFGMFANYKDRGDQFKAAVRGLAQA